MLHPQSILPYDGTVLYYDQILSDLEADFYFEQLLHTILWRNDEVMMYGKKITTKRKTAWYGDKPFEYNYSQISRKAMTWTKELLKLKQYVENISAEFFNSCLLNLYHTGEEGMSWHTDAEAELKKNGAIASLTLGASRKFSFKHKNTKEKIDLILHHGDLLIMSGVTQIFWAHALPKTKKVHHPRINLTFRTIEKQ